MNYFGRVIVYSKIHNLLLNKISAIILPTIISSSTQLKINSNFYKNGIRLLATELPSKSLKNATEIDKNHLLGLTDYAKQRKEFLALRRQIKAVNRVNVGPHASITFETFDLIWVQVQEMLHIEKGGDQQVKEELDAYNPLVPKGNNIVMTFMFEIDDKTKRDIFLQKAVGIENALKLKFSNHIIQSEPVKNEDSKTPSGFTSAIHFLQFKLSSQQITAFKSAQNVKVYVEVDHPSYPHSTALKPELVDIIKKLLHH